MRSCPRVSMNWPISCKENLESINNQEVQGIAAIHTRYRKPRSLNMKMMKYLIDWCRILRAGTTPTTSSKAPKANPHQILGIRKQSRTARLLGTPYRALVKSSKTSGAPMAPQTAMLDLFQICIWINWPIPDTAAAFYQWASQSQYWTQRRKRAWRES